MKWILALVGILGLAGLVYFEHFSIPQIISGVAIVIVVASLIVIKIMGGSDSQTTFLGG